MNVFVMEQLSEIINAEDVDRHEFYKLFSVLSDDNKELEDILSKIWELIGRKVLSKDIVYLSLLANRNFELLTKCIAWDKYRFKFEINNYSSLFDYTIYFKNHWFYEFINKVNVFTNDIFDKSIHDKIKFLKLIKLINNVSITTVDIQWLQERINDVSAPELGNFWSFCLEEIKYLVNIVQFCLNHDHSKNVLEMLHVTAENSALDIVSQHLNLCNDCTGIKKFFMNILFNKSPRSEDIQTQISTLSSYNILSNLLKLIICDKDAFKKININEAVNNIQRELLDVIEPLSQIDLLEIIFATIFIKRSDLNAAQCSDIPGTFVCNQKEVRLLLFILKSVIDKIWLQKIYLQGSEEYNRLEKLRKIVIDASWRLELIENVKSSLKCETKLLHYMLADPESLINICLKCGDFARASEVLKIFNLTETKLAKDVFYSDVLEDLKSSLKKVSKMRTISDFHPHHKNINYNEAVEEFLQKHPSTVDEEADKIISQNQNYPFLEHYLSQNSAFLNIMDLAITHTRFCDESDSLLQLASKQNTATNTDSSFSLFNKSVRAIFDYVGVENKLTVSELLLDPQFSLDLNQYKEKETFYLELERLYTEFCCSLETVEKGALNKHHQSHQVLSNIIKHCGGESDKVKYLQKLFTYLKAFSRVLYIETDSSSLVSNNKNTSFFELLSHNRSELMGKLLFQQNLDPNEFEKYFKKLKLDFLYHVTGNCFPTINLHVDENLDEDELYHENILYTPTKGVISYILKRNRLLALLLNEMYHVEDVEIDMNEIRIQNFLNYLRLPRIDNLKVIYKNSEILTALQNDISYRKVKDFVSSEMSRHEFTSSTATNQSFETAEEIFEEGVTTMWKRLADIVDSIPERQINKEKGFVQLRDQLLTILIDEAFECEYYKNVSYIKDRDKRIELLFDNMKTWPIDFCVKCIKHEISIFDVEQDHRLEELKCWLKHIENSKLVMDALGVTSWAHLYNKCAFTPVKVVRTLLFAKKVDVLIEFIELNDVCKETLLCVDEEFLLKAFELETNFESMQILLNILPQPHCITVCTHLLNSLKNIKHLQFIADFLSELVPDKSLEKIMMSLKILSFLSSNENVQALLALLHDPLSIIEVLIMNTKLDRLGEVLRMIKPLIPTSESEEGDICVENIDGLLRRYAAKSLDFRVISQPSQKMTTSERIAQEFLSSNVDFSQKGFVMPDVVPTKEEWVQNNEVTECMCCSNITFSMFNRRHHCRRCGRVVCGSCSKKRMLVPNYEDILVRVCLDCYNQTFKDQSVSDDNKSSWSIVEDFWILTNDPDHNRIVREEFSYEFAPSVSLCLSLMKYHSKTEEYSKFLLDQCELLLKLLMPNKELAREIDYLLVIRMIKSLAVVVKMTSQDDSESLVDAILNQAGILELLAENGCLHLLPSSGDIYSLSLRRLTDKLLEMEQWNLALKVSAKGGLDNSGIFVAWGKSCLKAGCLMLAREKFSKCLNRNSPDVAYFDLQNSTLKMTKNSPLLNDIIKILESKAEPIDQDVVNLVDSQRLMGSISTLSQSGTSVFPSEGAMFILNKIKKLKELERGVYQKSPEAKSEEGKLREAVTEPVIYEECIYYLTKYGNVISLVEFHLKYKQYRKILNYIVQNKITHEVFIYVYMKCLKEGNVHELQMHMSQIDSSLIIWQNCLRKLCFYLEKQNFLHSLYQLQQYMGDYVRAAMTCIRFYEQNASSFIDLIGNRIFLDKSEEHLKAALEQDQWVDVSTVEGKESRLSFEEKSITNPLLIKKMTYKDIEKNTQTIKLQSKVTQFLAICEQRGSFPMQSFHNIFPNPENLPKDKVKIPTLFGSGDDKKYLAVFCIICGETVPDGFPLALRIITDFNLKPMKVYNEAGKYLVQRDKFGSIAELVNHIRKSCESNDKLANEMCDEMLLHAVATVGKNNGSEADIEGLIRLISDKTMKISAYIESRQLKTAYFLATKHKRIMDIRRILKEAELLNQANIRILCQKALQKHSQANASTESDTN